MHKLYKFFALLFASTLLCIAWYFLLYCYIERLLVDNQKTLTSHTKNCLQADRVGRLCKEEKESLASLHNHYQQCIISTKEHDNDQGDMSNLINLIEKNNLHLDHCKRIAKERKEWYKRYTVSLSFHGKQADVLAFFEQLSNIKTLIVPSTIEIHTDNKFVTHVTTHLFCMMCI